MNKPWNDINFVGSSSGTEEEAQKSNSNAPVEEAEEEHPDEVRLISAEWKPGPQGFQYNKQCFLEVKAEFLTEKIRNSTIRTRIRGKLFGIYNDIEEDLVYEVEGFINKDSFIAKVNVKSLYFIHDEHYKAWQKDKNTPAKYIIKGILHSRGLNTIDSPVLEIPAQRKPIDVDFIVISDMHFNHNCALPCLDLKGELINLLARAFSFSKDNADRELIVEGHADTSGESDYNFTISKRRAEAVKSLLSNDISKWNEVVGCSDHRIEAEDYQATLKSLAEKYAWPCDPGPVDNHNGPKTQNAVKGFQTEYNKQFGKDLTVDGSVGPKTWESVGVVIRSLLDDYLKNSLKLDPIPDITYGYPEGNGIYPCGESCSIENAEDADYKSAENRRVELVFYIKGDSAPAVAPAAGRVVGPRKDPVSEKGWEKREIAPVLIKPHPTIEFIASESVLPEFWDPFLIDAPDNMVAVFTIDVDWHGEIAAMLLKDENEIVELPIVSPNTDSVKVEWTGLDDSGVRSPEASYSIRLRLIDNGAVIAEKVSSPVKLIRIGIEEISFVESFPIRIYNDEKKAASLSKAIDFSVPVPQWKINSLNDPSNTKPSEHPAPSLEDRSIDPDNYNYPVCYALNSKSPAVATIGGMGFSQTDSLSVTLISSINNTTCTSIDNENIQIGSSVHFENISKAIDSIQETITTLTFQFEHTKADKTKLVIGKYEIDKIYIYTVLSKPQEPWNNDFFTLGSDLWLSVLQLVCSSWAKGLKTVDAAAEAITDRIFNSGFKYDTKHGASFFTGGLYDAKLKSWLIQLNLDQKLRKPMNCTDCATILTCLANAMGCDLYSSTFWNMDDRSAGFSCHKILSIGFPKWDYPFSQYYGGTSGGFSYHEIGWKNGCTNNDPIFDPCLKTALDPVNKPANDPVLPTNIVFDVYKPKLVVQTQVSSVKPDSTSRTRRLVI